MAGKTKKAAASAQPKMNVLFPTSECIPFAKTGGLADVVGSLPKYFNKKKFDVRVILPKFAFIAEEYASEMKYIDCFYIDHCGRDYYVGVFEMELDGVKFYFIDNQDYFSGAWPYTDVRFDLEKYAFFSKAVLAAMPVVGFQSDVIHCHDWQTALIPVYVKSGLCAQPFYRETKTVMTIHNLKYQGVWDIATVRYISGLSDEFFTPDKLEAYGDGNFLKGGLAYADIITTVSPTYALEIMDPYYGYGLDGLLRARHDAVFGILNGIDEEAYNPRKDAYAYFNYNINTFKKKAENKAALQSELGLPQDPDAIVIGMISRLTEQKGFELVLQEGAALCAGHTQLVVLGAGDRRYEEGLSELERRHPDKVSVTLSYSDELAHKIYASADAFLMPSQFEPCGLSQMMAMRYGTLPIVRETGGLKDSVEPYDEYRDRGTGFSFMRYDAEDMIGIVDYAKRVYHEDRKAWNDMCKRAMGKDFSWNPSAARYEELYENLRG